MTQSWPLVSQGAEPNFGFGHGGEREFVLPGNREYVAGDKIPRPGGGGSGSGGGSEAGEGAETQDEFVFSLSREEFLDIFFDDLELPRLIRTQLSTAEQFKSVRAGYTTVGSPSNLSVPRTLGNALARRIALGGALRRDSICSRPPITRRSPKVTRRSLPA